MQSQTGARLPGTGSTVPCSEHGHSTIISCSYAPFPPLNDLELLRTRSRLLSVMDRSKLLEMVAHARREADQCERRMLYQRDRVRSLREAGEETGVDDKGLAELELAFDNVIAEMQNLLDELDKEAEASVTSQSPSGPLRPSSP